MGDIASVHNYLICVITVLHFLIIHAYIYIAIYIIHILLRCFFWIITEIQSACHLLELFWGWVAAFMTHKPLFTLWKIYTRRQSVHAGSVLDSLEVELAAEAALAKPLIQQALTTPGCENWNCIVFNSPVIFLGEDLFTYVLCEGPGLGPPRSPPTTPSPQCGVMKGWGSWCLRRLFRSQAAVSHSQGCVVEQADALSQRRGRGWPLSRPGGLLR